MFVEVPETWDSEIETDKSENAQSSNEPKGQWITSQKYCWHIIEFKRCLSCVVHCTYRYVIAYCHLQCSEPVELLPFENHFFSKHNISPPQGGGGYISFSLFICLSVCPSTVSVCLPPVCGHDFVHACSKEMDTWNFLKFCTLITRHLYTHHSPSEDVHLEFPYGLDNFSSLNRLFTVFWTLSFFKTRNIVLKITIN